MTLDENSIVMLKISVKYSNSKKISNFSNISCFYQNSIMLMDSCLDL